MPFSKCYLIINISWQFQVLNNSSPTVPNVFHNGTKEYKTISHIALAILFIYDGHINIQFHFVEFLVFLEGFT